MADTDRCTCRAVIVTADRLDYFDCPQHGMNAQVEGLRESLRVGRDMYVTVCEESERLRWALEEACADAWTDHEAQVKHYLKLAATRIAESRRPTDEERSA